LNGEFPGRCPHGVVNAVCWTCYVLANQKSELSYHDWVLETAAVMGSDGCTAAGPWFRWECFEHDIHARAGVRRDGSPISDEENDVQFRSAIQRASKVGWYSPVAWWRWLVVRWLVDSSAPNTPSRVRSLLSADFAAQRRYRIIKEVEAAA
jgi:hypothetical protein